MQLSVSIEVFKEDDLYVALAPQLNVSSFGESIDDARSSLKEAIEAFLEECAEMGSLQQVLEESGFINTGDSWQPRRPVLEESLAVAV
ncbi:MAG: hypothetical protein WCA08_26065 [Desulfoferrobacter sp.]